MRRRTFIAGLGSAAAWPIASWAQQSRPVVGLLSNQTESQGAPLAAAVRRGLGEQGFVEGQNVEILYRWAGGFDRLPLLAADLVRRRVAVIVTPGGGTGAALAAKAVTTTIPIVFAVGSDPVEMGLVANLSRPDGNLTGSTRLVQELTSKQLELLHNVVPAVSSVGFLRDPRVPYAAAQVREVEHAAPVLGVRVIFAVANNPGETEGAFGVLVGQRIGALMVGPSIMFSNQRDQITALAARYAVPAIYASREYVDVGGLMSYGANGADADRLAGAYAGRILKGEKPANLPVQQAAKVELTINLKAAKALGLTIPVNLLGRADEVIE